MEQEQLFADVIQDILTARKNGALYVNIRETSEDILRMYFKEGQIYHLRYGTAIGNDCLDILDYYNLYSATFFEGITAPDKPPADLPSTKEILAKIRQLNKKVKVT
ncbi:MAG: DUF4388 domain-containing protein [Nitrospirae bacterium]|nr:DUF4388 domain-containing protein [Nitrospirota bacterium]